MARRRVLILGLLSLVVTAWVATGCFLFGQKKEFVSIAGGGKVVDIQVRLEDVGDQPLCPGEDYQIGIRVRTKKGKSYTTWKRPEDGSAPDKTGHLDFSEFEFKVHGGHIEEGMFRVDPDALVGASKGYRIAAAVKDDTKINAEASYKLKIGCAHQADFRGTTGAPGYDGAAGTEASAGGDGGAPGIPEGGQGGDGGFGGNGGEAEVASTLVSTPEHDALVLIKVTPKGQPARHFLVDPTSEEGFTIDCRGGDGGRGGNGGPGATAGNGGRGGAGGDGGDGGIIKGYFDAGQVLLQTYVKYLVSGGAGGAAGEGGAAGGRDAEGRPMLPGRTGDPGQPGKDGPWPDVRPEGGANLFDQLPEGVAVLTNPWVPPPAAGIDAYAPGAATTTAPEAPAAPSPAAPAPPAP